ncbi:pilin [Acinetobacter bereziniae]|uniref:pilin n=2 Tax=Acinetobacter bereziniae TaxID=106648 RepID=UPI0025AE87E1|nr:prepilin-type N-terminal cleavage/methylation domain-containing protein [Acinetobacter bereziniae]
MAGFFRDINFVGIYMIKTINGFTLIEVMIVVAIISILAAISFPTYIKYIKKTEVNACLAEVNAYANIVYLILNSPEKEQAIPVANNSACVEITDASTWNEFTNNLMIEAKSKNSSTVDIRCDLSKGANCTIIP